MKGGRALPLPTIASEPSDGQSALAPFVDVPEGIEPVQEPAW